MPLLDLLRPAHAHFFGFARTDGSLYAGAGQKGRFTIQLSRRDEAVLRSFSALFDVKSRVSYRDRTTNFGPHRSAVRTVSDLAFRRELIGLGMPAGRKAATGRATALPLQRRLHPYGTAVPSFVTASQALADFFCEQALAVAGVHRSVTRNARDGVFNPMVTAEPAALLAAWLYSDGCLALDRERAAARRVAAWTRPAEMRTRPQAGARRWTSDDDAAVFSGSVGEVACRLGRSEKAVAIRRVRLRKATGVSGDESLLRD